MKRNNRNTLLLISGMTQFIKGFINCIMLLVVSICFDMINLRLKMWMYSTDFYAYEPAFGERLMNFIIIAMFIYLGLAIAINFTLGIICLDEAKQGAEPLRFRRLIIALSVINVMTLTGFIGPALNISALLADKNQPDTDEAEKVDVTEMKKRIEQIKELKKEKAITQQEYIDMLTELLTK